MAPTSLLSRSIFLLSALYQIGGTFTADWSASHIYNAAWPPHAKFHTGQTMSMAIVLGLLGLYFAFRPAAQPLIQQPLTSLSQQQQQQPQQPQQAQRNGDGDVWTAMLILDVYWVTQALAFLYPGTHWCDEGFCHDVPFPPQLAVEFIGMGLNAAAYGAEVWALRSADRQRLLLQGKGMGKKGL